MLNCQELFFDLWPILDNPQRFSFFKFHQTTDDILLIQNTLIKNTNNYICVLDSKIDFQILDKVIPPKKTIIDFYTREKNWNNICGDPKHVKISLINSSIIYEYSNPSFSQKNNVSQCIVSKVINNDYIALSTDYESMEHDYIKQISDATKDINQSVYCLRYKSQPVCFLVLNNCISEKYKLNCNNIAVIYTLPSYRNNGYAKYLVSFILGKNKGKPCLYVADSDNNIATNNLAKSCGFKVIGYNHQLEIVK